MEHFEPVLTSSSALQLELSSDVYSLVVLANLAVCSSSSSGAAGPFCGRDSLSPFLTGRMFLREPSWKYSEKLVGSSLGKLFFANLVESIRRSYIRGPKSFAQHVLGTFALFDDHCL